MQTNTRRIEIFSDGVIAIIITIMVLELKLPELSETHDRYEIKQHLIDVLPHLGAYIFSFIMVGILWTSHHHLFNLLEKTDGFLLAQNLFFLFWMSLIPFVTNILGSNPLLSASTALYGFIMLMNTLALSFMRSYTLKKGLIHTDERKDVKKKIQKVSKKDKIKSYMETAAYFLSVPLAFVSVYLSYVCFVIPIILFLLPAKIDEEMLADKVIEKNK